jgi:Cys-tRNA(Pro)/Cys-tRNA(Cys) deacylase
MAKKEKEEKTNVMRLLEAAGIPYTPHQIPLAKDDPLDGVTAARKLGKAPEQVFKTLVAEGPKKEHFVFVIPVAETLDLKKAARAAGVKSIAMLPQKQLLPLTGYVHGGCSPVGMAKHFPTFFAEEVILVDTMLCSAGKIGYQVEVTPEDLIALVGGEVTDLTVSV